VYASIGVSVTAHRFRAEREKLRAAAQTIATSASRTYEPLDPLGRLTGAERRSAVAGWRDVLKPSTPNVYPSALSGLGRVISLKCLTLMQAANSCRRCDIERSDRCSDPAATAPCAGGRPVCRRPVFPVG
jgi:hypothetical protein